MKKRALALGTYVNAPYHPMDGVDERLKETLTDFDLTFSGSPEALREAADFDLVISYLDLWNGAAAAGEEPAEALKAFVEAGGGLLTLHNGICLARTDSLKTLIGGAFAGHPDQETLTFAPVAGGPLSGIPPFSLREEPYRFDLPESIPHRLILAYAFDGAIWPAGWTRLAGRGRVCNLCPGHTAAAFDVEAYREMIRRAAAWTVASGE